MLYVLSHPFLQRLHETLHSCSTSVEAIAVVLESHNNTVTRDTFVEVLQGCHVACRRDTELRWDMRGQDVGMQGSLGNVSASMVYAANASDVETPNFAALYEQQLVDRLDSVEVGYHAFQDALINMPNLADYLN